MTHQNKIQQNHFIQDFFCEIVIEEFRKPFALFVELLCTLYNVILRIARNFLETRENVKISTHPFYHTNLD